MSDTCELRISRSVIRTWSLWDAPSLLCAEVDKTLPFLRAICDDLADTLTFPSSGRPFSEGAYVRPEGHERTYYIALDKQSKSEGAPRGHIAVKGSEIAASDYPEWLAAMRRRRQFFGLNGGLEFGSSRSNLDTTINMLERWPVIEHKVPGAVTAREARGEAEAAFDFQQAHVARYGNFARVPLPLAVYKWGAEQTRRTLDYLARVLSRRAMEIVEKESGDGLGVYVYYYPCVPLRLSTLELGSPAGGMYGARLAAVCKAVEPRALIDRWLSLAVRMLVLGFVPKNPACFLTADCMQHWNMTIDGGCADLDSLISADVLDDADFDDALRRTVRALVVDIGLLLVGAPALTIEFRDRYPELTASVFGCMRERLEKEAVAHGVPSRVARFFDVHDIFSSLDALFRRAAVPGSGT